MALSYNLGYQESISVHPTRRQIFAGKLDSTFPNIWEWLIDNKLWFLQPIRTTNSSRNALRKHSISVGLSTKYGQGAAPLSGIKTLSLDDHRWWLVIVNNYCQDDHDFHDDRRSVAPWLFPRLPRWWSFCQVVSVWKSGWNGLRWVEVSNRREGVALPNKWQMDIFIVQFQE